MIILDCIIMILLAATICYAVILNKRLTIIHQSRAELEKFIGNFSASLLKAENSVENLKDTSQKIITSMLDPLTKGQILRDELSFLIDRGNLTADRLEESTRLAKDISLKVNESENFVSERVASNDAGPAFQDINSELIISLKDIR